MKNKRGQIEAVSEPVKKSRWWIWLVVALVLIGLAIGAWLLFGGDGTSVVGGSSGLRPPALPN